MKKLFALLLIGFVLFVALNRLKLFLRDPLAKVTRDGARVENAHVMINFPNDILLFDSSGHSERLYLVQHWDMLAAVPTAPLKCFKGLACLTDADQATASRIAPGSRGSRPAFEGVTMTDRRVEFVDEDGALVEVLLH